MKNDFTWFAVGVTVSAIAVAGVLAPPHISLMGLTALTGALLIGASYRHPRFAWVLFSICLMTDRLSIALGPINIRPEHLAFALLIVNLARSRQASEKKARGELVIAATAFGAWLFLATATSLIHSPEPARSYYVITLYALGVFSFYVTSTGGDAIWRVKASILVLSTYSLAGIASWLIAEAGGVVTPLVILNNYEDTYRIQGMLVEPNFLGSACVMWLCLLSAYRDSFSAKEKVYHVSILSSTMLLTFTRAAWLAAILLAIVAVLVGSRSRLAKVFAAFTIFIAAAVVFAVAPGGKTDNAILTRGTSLFNFDSGTGAFRARDWSRAIEQMDALSGWLWGLGTNSYSQRNFSRQTSSGEAYLGNLWLSILHDTGIFGLFLFITGLTFIAISSKNRIAMLTLMATIALTSAATNQTWFMYPWVALALLTAPSHLTSPATDSRERRRLDFANVSNRKYRDLKVGGQL